MTNQITGQMVIELKKAETSVTVDFDKMPQASKDHVIAYGIRQILNDAMASAKTAQEGLGNAQKRLDNLMSGTLRASPVREGNPVRARAMELAMAKIIASPKFKEWLATNKAKASDKEAVAAARANAKRLIDAEGNPFMAQAEKDVAAAKGLEVEIELEF